MGREAKCICNWEGSQAKVKALIEPPELILRGGIRRRLPFAKLQHVHAAGERLEFSFEGEHVSLLVGESLAPKWLKVLTNPPPSLAAKLGIGPDSPVRMIGPVDDDALREALSVAKAVKDEAALILARVDTPQALDSALAVTATQLRAGVPIWFIYPKGKGHALTEDEIRAHALGVGIVDTKVAAVSSRLTAIRFVRRRT